MKKGMIIGIIAAVIVIALVATFVFMCMAPSIPLEGTYVSESGMTAVISGNTLTCEEKGDTANLKKVGFSMEYFTSKLTGGKYVIYNLDTPIGYDQADIASMTKTARSSSASMTSSSILQTDFYTKTPQPKSAAVFFDKYLVLDVPCHSITFMINHWHHSFP